jgi:pimeloyl-ACP methyl ester carboxylesterase/DNA-binding SARP family transcriptional activator
VRIDGQVAPLALKRGLALIAVVAELGRKVARVQLAALLWPDVAADVGRARLRRVLHECHQALRVDVLVGDADALWLSEAVTVDSDVARIRRLARGLFAEGAAEAPSREAAELLLQADAHQLLEGFEFGSDAFDDWLAQRRGEQHRLVARALQRLGERWLDAGQPAPAIEAAQRLAAIDPLADAGHALLLRAHALRGDLGAMESAYLAFAALLRSELGVRPSPAYESLYAQARQPLLQAAPSPSALPIRFADSDDGTVAYLELGRGPRTLVVLFGLWSHVEVAWDEPAIRAVLQRLAQHARVVLMDRRGVGLSERLARDPSLSAGVNDVEAVRRALGGGPIWLFGNAVGAMIALEYAALHPWAPTLEQLDRWTERLRSGWGSATSLQEFAPSQADDPVARDWWARLLRQSMSRNSVPALLREFARMDVRHRLPQLRAPTLLLQREGDLITRLGAAQYLAEHIAGARLTVLPGQDHNLWAGDAGAVIDEVERFMQGG